MSLQRSSYTQATLRDQVRGDLGLRGQSFLADGDIDRWAQRAQKRIAFETHWYRTTASADTAVGTGEYSLPASAISIEECYYNALPLTGPVPLSYFEVYRTNFRQEGNGTPTHWYVHGAGGVTLFPTPDTLLVNGITYYYTAYPANPVNDPDFYYVPTVLEEAIPAYCKLQAALKDIRGEGGDRVRYYASEWADWLKALKSFVADVPEGEPWVGGAHGVEYHGSVVGWNADAQIPAP